MSVMGSNGRLGCANHVERGTCSNRRTLLRDALLKRVLVGLKERLLAPGVGGGVRSDLRRRGDAANRDRGAQQARITQEHGKVGPRRSATCSS